MEILCFKSKALRRRQPKSNLEQLIVSRKRYINHVPFESGSDDTKEVTKTTPVGEDLFEIVSAVRNEKSVTSSLTTAKKNEDMARAEALRYSSLF